IINLNDKGGTSESYTIRRLKRDRPELEEEARERMAEAGRSAAPGRPAKVASKDAPFIGNPDEPVTVEPGPTPRARVEVAQTPHIKWCEAFRRPDFHINWCECWPFGC